MDQQSVLSTSKRRFLTGSAAAFAATMLPHQRLALAAQEYDLIVIGAGTAGIPAAIFASQRGAKVLVIEKSTIIGGTLDRSTAQMSAAGTVFQERAGITDTADKHYEDIMRISRNTADPELSRLFVANAADSINWLAEHGFEPKQGHPVKGAAHEPFETRRYLWGADGGRTLQAVMEPLYRAGENAGQIKSLMEHRAVDLIQGRDGRVTGVVAEDAAGKLTDFAARNVLIASGGCAANPRMYADLHGVPLTAMVAHPMSQGEGITLGQSAGGQLWGGDKYMCLFGAMLADDSYPSPIDASLQYRIDVRQPWELYVNAHGKRFMQEDNPSANYRELALADQPGHRFWVVADQSIRERAPMLMQGWDKDQQDQFFERGHPMLSTAGTLDALAVKGGIHPRSLGETVAEYNRGVRKAGSDPFGREHRPAALTQPPYYALRLTGWSLISFAGLVVDDQLRVLNEKGAPIRNLYAAGEVIGAGATSGHAYTNGAMVTPAITFGRLLGQRMLDFAT